MRLRFLAALALLALLPASQHEQIVFARVFPQPGQIGLYVSNADGTNEHPKDEAIYTGAPQPYGEIFMMRFDGTKVQQLTDNQWEDGTPAWQPALRTAKR